MARRGVSAALALVCFFATVIAGLYRVNAATTKEGADTIDGVWSCASSIATAVREKILECAGASTADGILPLFLIGAAAAVLAAFTLYALRLCLDKEPFLFNGGKMGKLEAQSCYTREKKCC